MLVKAFSLLNVLDEPATSFPLRDLAKAAGVPRPTAHRILGTLLSLGYVQKGAGGIYRLSRRPAGRAVLDPTRLVSAARAEVEQLSHATGETVNLGILRADRIVYLLVIESTHALRRVVTAGETDAAHSTALGRAILAHLPDDEFKLVLGRIAGASRLRRAAAQPTVATTRLRQLLSTVQRDKYAVEQDETDLGVTCVGVPVLIGRQCVAALSVSAPTARFTLKHRDAWVKRLQQAARRIAATLDDEE